MRHGEISMLDRCEPRLAVSVALLVAVIVGGGSGGILAEEPGQSAPPPTPPAEEAPAEADAEPPPEPAITERIVVSASATAQTVRDAPAAVDVIDGADLEDRPGDHLVDQLRRIPGINVVQFSARDVNIASRSSTGGINNTTLALTDGRSLYQDFLGFVMWEFAPTDFSLVDRVEVIRGPASSLWGANAVGGLVHVVTKSPRDTLGGQLTLEGGNYAFGNVAFRESFLAGPWALRVSAGYRTMDAFDRPATVSNFLGETVDPDLGLIDDVPASDTRQPRFDVRADWDDGSGATWILQGGWGRTAGWIATGLGPFDIDAGTGSSYVQVRYLRGPFEAQMSSNFFDGDAVNLINALPFAFTSGTTQASFRGRSLIAGRGVLGWGAELQRSTYDLSIAPRGDRRSAASLFGELDLPLAEKWKLFAGARVDHVHETIGTVVSPRAALRYKPGANHTLRAAWGEAFRAPSVVESNLLVPSIPVAILDWEEIDAMLIADDVIPDLFEEIGFFALMAREICKTQPDNCGAAVGATPTYTAVTSAFGSLELDEEVTQSFELGYSGQYGPLGVSVAVYRTRSEGGIDFPQRDSYGLGRDGIAGTGDDILLPIDPEGDGIDNLPAVDMCPFNIAILGAPFDTLCAQGPVLYNEAVSYLLDGQIPESFQYGNNARAENQGVELGLSWNGPAGLSAFANYSWQDEPRADGVKMSDRVDNVIAERSTDNDLDGDGLVGDTDEFINIPAEHRLSLSVQMDRRRWFGAATLDFVDETFWQDVLTPDFWGYVDSYSLVGLSGGWRWPRHGLELSGQVTNLTDDEIQQHIYGDIIGRRASLTLKYSWAPPGPVGDSR